MKRWMLITLTALGAAACTQATEPESRRPVDIETRAQAIGEATQAYWFSGAGAGPMPSLAERQAWQLINQVRMYTDVYDVRDMEGNLIAPQPPMVLQPGMIEVGRWQGQHGLQNGCACGTDMEGNPTPAAAGNSPFTCCTLGHERGIIGCEGPVVACGEEGLTSSLDRWGMMNRGPGEIQSEVYLSTEMELAATGLGAAGWFLENALGLALSPRTTTGAVAQVDVGIVPEECRPPEDSCAPGGDCIGPDGQAECDPDDPDAPNECIGTCDRGPKAGEFCTIPEPLDPATCDPENYPRGYWWSFMFGQTSEPTPFIADAIHTHLAEDVVSVAVNWFDPVGPPQLLQVATTNACNDMERTFTRPGEGMNGGGDTGGGSDAGPDAGLDAGNGEGDEGQPHVGETYHWDVSETGCIRYVVYAVDAEGFEHTYPTYGSLGMNLAAGGEILPNDDSCPIWLADERPEPSCLPAADECANGSSRICYTGRPGTEDKGICDVGTETCRNGRWAGICEGEVLPETVDTCGDDEDQNCNGYVDEDCPVPVDETPDAGGSAPDAGGDAPDMGAGMTNGGNNGNTDGDGDGDGGDDGGCCTTVDGAAPRSATSLLILLVALVALRRRRA